MSKRRVLLRRVMEGRLTRGYKDSREKERFMESATRSRIIVGVDDIILVFGVALRENSIVAINNSISMLQ